MIKKIIHTADIHIRNFNRHEQYRNQLSKFLNEVRNICSDFEFNEVRVLIVGDIFHQKIQTSNEQTDLLSWFLIELDKIAPTILVAGNHDFMESNKDRMDSITPIINLLNLKNVKFLDKELNYHSGIYIDDNIAWSLYSIFDDYNKPNVKLEKINYSDKKFIGLFHGALNGSKTDSGFEFEHGISLDYFSGCDTVMCGDIHKRHEIQFNSNEDNIKAVYPGSLIQQDFGENVSGHGFLLWDVEELEYEEFDIENDYSLFKFKITSIEDIENQTEEFVNF